MIIEGGMEKHLEKGIFLELKHEVTTTVTIKELIVVDSLVKTFCHCSRINLYFK